MKDERPPLARLGVDPTMLIMRGRGHTLLDNCASCIPSMRGQYEAEMSSRGVSRVCCGRLPGTTKDVMKARNSQLGGILGLSSLRWSLGDRDPSIQSIPRNHYNHTTELRNADTKKRISPQPFMTMKSGFHLLLRATETSDVNSLLTDRFLREIPLGR